MFSLPSEEHLHILFSIAFFLFLITKTHSKYNPKKRNINRKGKKKSFFFRFVLEFPPERRYSNTPADIQPFGCRRGGMADALRSGRSPFTRVEVQVLSSAPLFSSKRGETPPFCARSGELFLPVAVQSAFRASLVLRQMRRSCISLMSDANIPEDCEDQTARTPAAANCKEGCSPPLAQESRLGIAGSC